MLLLNKKKICGNLATTPYQISSSENGTEYSTTEYGSTDWDTSTDYGSTEEYTSTDYEYSSGFETGMAIYSL